MPQVPSDRTTSTIKFYLPSLRRYARALTRDRELADALVRDCLERAVSRIDLAPSTTDLRVWLLALLQGEHARRASGERPVSSRFIGDSEEPAELHAFRVAFDRLTIEDRQILLLTGLEGLTSEEAAEVLGISPATVQARVSEARKRLYLSQRDVAELSPAALVERVELPRKGVAGRSFL
ncbi:sigma factor-like helix-turn-helix DNA-binding protein [Rhodospirillaceae bacterium SYSU D60014]|uniref:sigma factor-like helix-turn-helix DNA-binding protein n=1 Tax=Virgifigura deserti TaxID=2268457 RepID=UPI000E663B66